jgi:hypothetical protein
MLMKNKIANQVTSKKYRSIINIINKEHVPTTSTFTSYMVISNNSAVTRLLTGVTGSMQVALR